MIVIIIMKRMETIAYVDDLFAGVERRFIKIFRLPVKDNSGKNES